MSLEPRRFQNIENIESYNRSLLNLTSYFEESIKSYLYIDTTNKSQQEVTDCLMEDLMTLMRKKAIKNFKKEYHIK